MNIEFPIRRIALAVMLTLSMSVCGQTPQSGIELFKSGHFDKAVEQLERDVVRNPHDVDTMFLLGVTYQRLGRNAEAAGALRRVIAVDGNYLDAQLPLGIVYYQLGLPSKALPHLMRALEVESNNASAWMFLGLTQRSLGKHLKSIKSFRHAADLDSDLRQSALLNIGVAESQIGKRAASQTTLRQAIDVAPDTDIAASARSLVDQPNGTSSTVRPWSLIARAGVEYDDNVTTSEVDLTTDEDDAAAIFDFSASYLLLNSEKSELELGYDFYQSLYSALSDFDLQLHTASALGSHTIGSLDLGGSYRFTHASLGGSSFFDIHDFRPSIGFGFVEKLFHSISYSYQDKDFKTDNDRDGDQHGVNFDSYYFFNRDYFAHAALRFESEDTDGPQFDYAGYYVTLGLSGVIASVPNNPAKVRFAYRYYLRDYDKDTPSIGKEREDQRHTISLGLKQPITKNFSALLNYEYLSADSNLPTADFTENVVSVSLELAL